MEPSAYVIRVKFMAKPGEQFILRREVRARSSTCWSNAGATGEQPSS
jgi:hypothetical protein